jgi:hypothetical protein
MYTYILTTSGRADNGDFNTLIKRLENVNCRELDRSGDIVLIFSEEHPEKFSGRLFSGIHPHPEMRLILISETAFFPK